MKRKVLAVELNPPIKGFTVFSLSILATNELYLPWFYSQHIQLYFAKTQIQKGVPKIDFYRPPNNRLLPSPLLETRWLDRDLISIVNEDIVQFVVKYIDRDYYVQLYLNEFYMPDRSNYNTQKNIHETLIHGYDLYDETFDIIGYNKMGQYVSSKLKFADFKKAYTKIDYSDFKEAYMKIKYSPNHMAKIGLLKYDNNRRYEFDLNLVLEQIRDYIESNNTSEKFRMLDAPEDGIYGIETYCHLIHCLLEQRNNFDIRLFHILWEHKKCMLNRLIYMENKGCLDPYENLSVAYNKIEREVANLRLVMLRGILGSKKEKETDTPSIKYVKTKLEKSAGEEKRILARVLLQCESP